MTLLKQSSETATLAAISTSNPSGDNPFNQVNTSGATAAVDTTHAAAGSNSIKFTPASGSVDSARWTGLGSSTGFAVSFYLWIDTLPAVETFFCNITTSGGTRVLLLEISNSGKFRVIDTTGTSTPVWTDTTNFPTGQWVRVEAYATIAAGTATMNAAYYLGDSTTAVASKSVTTANTGTTAADTVIFGKGDSGTYASAFWMDNLQFQTAASALIGPWIIQLATPTVTLGTTTNTTSTGGTNGSQVVSWSAVPNATTYDAYKATKASPLQSDFTLVASGVTSPYTFTGLGAGTYSYGIMPKP